MWNIVDGFLPPHGKRTLRPLPVWTNAADRAFRRVRVSFAALETSCRRIEDLNYHVEQIRIRIFLAALYSDCLKTTLRYKYCSLEVPTHEHEMIHFQDDATTLSRMARIWRIATRGRSARAPDGWRHGHGAFMLALVCSLLAFGAAAHAQSATTTTLSSSLNPSTFGQSVTLTATVTSAGGTPTGSVDFKIDSSTLATVPLDGSGVGTFVTSDLVPFSAQLSAAYVGAAAFSLSNSPTITQVVQLAPTTVGLTISQSSWIHGDAVSIEATVSCPGDSARGSFELYDGATLIQTKEIPLGLTFKSVQFDLRRLSVGSHSLVVKYSGNNDRLLPSTSSAVSVTVNPLLTTTTLSSSLNPAQLGQNVTFTAKTTNAQGRDRPNGSIIFRDGSKQIAEVNYAYYDVQATFTTSTLSLGSHNITAEFVPSSSLYAESDSVSSALTQTIIKPTSPVPTSTALTSSLNPSAFGQPVTFTVKVTSSLPLVPAGSVSLAADNGQTTQWLGGTTQVVPITQTALASGEFHSCSVGSDGAATCWGYNGLGGLGDGSTTYRLAPVPVTGLQKGGAAIAGGRAHSCAITTGGGLKCWGNNLDGQLGDGTTVTRLTPVQVPSLTSGVSAIALGASYSCALTNAGAVKCWGDNAFGQLGDGTTTDRSTPVQVSGLSSGVVAISASGAHSCALTAAGSVLCWGYNQYGQLGDGTQANRPLPTAVSSLPNGIAAIDLGDNHSCARSTGGAVLCWGDNESGQLGDGTLTSRSTPGQVSGMASGIAAISMGGDHSCALTTTGAVRCWGKNADGQLGDGTKSTRLTPVQVSDLVSGIAAISSGSAHSCALSTAGSVQCWGSNLNQQLGDGTFKSSLSPVSTGHPAQSTVSFTISSLQAETYRMTAIFSDVSTQFAGSISPSLTHTVTSTTSISLTSTPNPAKYGQPVSFTATLSSPGGLPVQGKILFKDGGVGLGQVNLSSGTATTTLALGVGVHALTAEYFASASHSASVSNVLNQQVTKDDSFTTLSVSPGSAQPGQSVTLAATVRGGNGFGTPSGSVVFRDGATVLGTVPLSAGAASFSTSSLGVGGHSLTASYGGDTLFLASVSPARPLTVNRSCGDALQSASVITGASGAASGSTNGATGEIGEPNHAGSTGLINSVWCQWTAPATGAVTFETTGSLFDTTLAVYTGSIVSMLTPIASNDNIAPTTAQSRVTFTAQKGTVYKIVVDGAGNAKGTCALSWTQVPASPSLFAAVLPTSRSVLTGSTATAFATLVNGGNTTLTQCRIALPQAFPSTFSYQATTSANVPTGPADTPVDIPVGTSKSFVFSVTPTVDLNAAEVALVFACSNSPPAPSVLGLNTLTLSSSSVATPDILAIASTPSNDGIVTVPPSGTGVFAAAAVNIGAAGNVTVSVDDGGRNLPLTITLCRSDPATGACVGSAKPAAIDSPAIAANEVLMISVFVKATGPVAFDPSINRLQLRLKTDDGVTRGSTSVAVRTQ
jgi:alpha-tubulin suppressor-like RCC1 family protein